MTDIIFGAIIVVIIAAAARYVYKAKKRGVKCVGCPSGCCCSNDGSCSCHGDQQ